MENKERPCDPILTLATNHKEFYEKEFILAVIPGEISRDKWWLKIKQIEDFFNLNIKPHFQLEEEYIFPYLLKNPSKETVDLIGEIREEHFQALDKIERVEKIFYTNTFPLKSELLNEVNAIMNELSSALTEHAKKEDNILFPKYHDTMNIPGTGATEEKKPGTPAANTLTGTHSTSLHKEMEILKLMAKSELMVALLYNKCAERFDEDASFWFDLVQEEIHHNDNLNKMLLLINRNPENFKPSGLYKSAAIETFIAGIKSYTERLENGHIPIKNMLFIARDIETSIIENKYETIVSTQDPEYRALASEISGQTASHKNKIDEKIKRL